LVRDHTVTGDNSSVEEVAAEEAVEEAEAAISETLPTNSLTLPHSMSMNVAQSRKKVTKKKRRKLQMLVVAGSVKESGVKREQYSQLHPLECLKVNQVPM